MLCVVFGIPGSGKTTVLTAVAKHIELTRLNFGDYMFNEAKKQGLVKSRDRMKRLPLVRQAELQLAAAEKIHTYSRKGNIILDTHASIKTPRGYMPGLPEKVLRALAPEAFVIVQADPGYIYNRRSKDALRNRDGDTIEDIEEHQKMNRAFAAVCATLTGSTVLIVKNEEGKVATAAKKIAGLFK